MGGMLAQYGLTLAGLNHHKEMSSVYPYRHVKYLTAATLQCQAVFNMMLHSFIQIVRCPSSSMVSNNSLDPSEMELIVRSTTNQLLS